MEDLKENLNKVVGLCENTYSTEEIISILKNGTVMEKQVAVLSLNELHSKDDVKILMENLTGIDGKVRQAVAFKILQLIPTYKNLFLEESFYEIFANSIIDIDSVYQSSISKDDFSNHYSEYLELLHNNEKSAFFDLLNKDYLESLKPIY